MFDFPFPPSSFSLLFSATLITFLLLVSFSNQWQL